MIVVTAPTGQIGRQVVRDLLDRNAPVRVIVRDPARLPTEIRDRVEVLEGSHGEPTTIDRALEGAGALFWLAPPDPSRTLQEVYLDFARPAVDAIRRRKVPRIVSVTALGRGTAWQDDAGLVTASIGMDDLLMSSGAAFRGLAMPSFMENVLRQMEPIRDRGVFFGPIEPDLKVLATATRDMGAVAARLLADDGWSGQEEVPVVGPEYLSANEMAEIMSEVLDRSIRYQQISLDALKRQFLDRGASESFAQGYVDMFRAKGEGMDNVAVSPVGSRTSTTFRRFCEAKLRSALAG